MNKSLSRRRAITLGAVGAGAVAVTVTGVVVAQNRGSAAPAGASSGGLREPTVLTSSDGLLELDLETSYQQVKVGSSTAQMMTYNGSVPGPTMHVRPGDRLLVHFRNTLDMPTNLHTHGLVVSAADNGDNPFVTVEPGATFDYDIQLPTDHPNAVCWYHPHHHGMAANQVFAGLYGAIIVDNDDWNQIAPRVLVISDVTINNGAVAAITGMDQMMGRTGTSLLVNGQVAPQVAAPPGTPQRFVLVNACASRYLNLDLTGLGAELRGIDSGHQQQSVDSVLLVPGNRADLVVTMPSQPRDLIAAEYRRGNGGMMGGSATSPQTRVLTLAPDAQSPARAVAPGQPEAHPDLRQVAVDRSRVLSLTMSMGNGRFLIDGRSFDPNRVDTAVSIGTVEQWTLTNNSAMDHPFHLHTWPMQLIRVGTTEVTGVDVRDVVDVPAGTSVTVRISFDRFPAKALYHCHILDHEDLGMMGVIEAS